MFLSGELRLDLLAEIVGPFPANITRLTNLGECIALYCNRSCSRGHVVCVERQSWKLTGLVVPNVSRFSCMKHVSPSLVPHLSPSFVHSVALSLSLSLSLSLCACLCFFRTEDVSLSSLGLEEDVIPDGLYNITTLSKSLRLW